MAVGVPFAKEGERAKEFLRRSRGRLV